MLATFRSSTEITCPDPGSFADEATTVVEATVNGVDYSSNGVELTHNRRPHALSIRPTSGSHRGGTSVFASGVHFPASERLACTFGEASVPARWLSGELLQCDSPPGPANAAVTVRVALPGSNFSSNVLNFYFRPSMLLNVFPPSGPEGGGTPISIFGEAFPLSSDIAVCFGLVEVQAKFLSSSHLQCISPEHRRVGVSRVHVSVVIDGVKHGGGPNAIFTYAKPAFVSFLDPPWGFKGDDTNVTLYGDDFANTTELACAFGEDRTTLIATFVSESRISCRIPAWITDGDYSMEVTTNGRDFTDDGGVFVIVNKPHVLSVTPLSGSERGGEAVNIRGVNFKYVSGLECWFGVKAMEAWWESKTSLWCTSPAGSRGTNVQLSITLQGLLYSSVQPTFGFRESSAGRCTPSVRSTAYAAKVTTKAWTTDINSSNLTCGSVRATSWTHHLPDGTLATFRTEDQCGGSMQSTTPLFGAENVSGRTVVLPHVDRYGLKAATASILRITPDHGSHEGGTRVLVSGTNFPESSHMGCTFGALTVAGHWLSPSLILCVSPAAGGRDSVLLDVIVNGVASDSACAFNYEVCPTITGITPSFGSLQGGTIISIRGQGFAFSRNLSVRFGNTSVSATFVSTQELLCTSPPSLAGSASLSIGDFDKAFGSDFAFVYRAAPIVHGLHPSRGSVGGRQKITVQGEHFADTSNLACMVGKASVVAASFISDTEMECYTPVLAEPGPKEVEITVNGVDFTLDGHVFTYVGIPAVFSVTPDSGSAGGGTVILVRGINFVDSDELACHFGNSSVSGRWISSTAIQCVSPISMVNDVISLRLSFVYGQTETGGVDFLYFSQPTISEISPYYGTFQGGTSVVIVGTSFWFSGGLRVRFGRTDVPATFLSASELRCIAPPSLPGSSEVFVSFNGVDFFGRDGVAFQYTAPPEISLFSPTFGPQDGGTQISVRGSGFGNGSDVKCVFGKDLVLATLQSEATITCVTPPARDKYTVSFAVTVNGMRSNAGSKDFLYIKAGHTLAIYPGSGPSSGGSAVCVSGYNFFNSPALTCRFGLQGVSAQWVSSTQVRCISPSVEGARVVTLAVEVEGGERLAGVASFQYYTQPTFSRIAPNAGSSAGGTTLSLVGDNFIFSRELWAGIGRARVSTTFINSTLLRCVTVASTPKKVQVNLSIAGVSVPQPDGIFYTFADSPQVVAIEPSRGRVAGGIPISVHGRGFNDIVTLACRFGSSEVNSVQAKFISTENIVCVTPTVAALGPLPMEVTVNGVDFSSNRRQFTFTCNPFISSVSPTQADTRGGARILIQGGFFIDSAELGCIFGSSINTPARWLSPTLIECVSPSTATLGMQNKGVTSLAVRFGDRDQTDAVQFRRYEPAMTFSVHPVSGPSAGGATIFLTGENFFFTGDIRVRFDGVEVPGTFLNRSLISCVTPAGAVGFSQVAVVTGSSVVADIPIRYQYLNDVKINEAVIKLSKLGGSATAIVGGVGFTNTTNLACRFGRSIVMPAVFLSTREIVCDVPSSLLFARASLETTMDGQYFMSADRQLQHADGEYQLNLNPSSGPAKGGTFLIVTGRQFPHGCAIECTFGPMRATGVWLSKEAIQCPTPPWQKEAKHVRVAVLLDGYASGHGSYLYKQASVTSVYPKEGEDLGGTLVTVSGSGFDSNQQWFCWFGAEKGPGTVLDDKGTLLQCVSPPSTTWNASVRVSIGTGSGLPVPSTEASFTYIPSIEVVSLAPSSGSVLGGTSVVVTLNRGLKNHPPSLQCDFGDVGSSETVWLNVTAGVCLSPASPFRGKVVVSLRSSAADDKLIGAATAFWYYYPPTVSFVYPVQIEETKDSSAMLMISGGNFDNAGPLCCQIDKIIVQAFWISESLMHCSYSGINPGKHEIAVSNNMADFVPAGVDIIVLPRGAIAVGGRSATYSQDSVTDTALEISRSGLGSVYCGQHCGLANVPTSERNFSLSRTECPRKIRQRRTVTASVHTWESYCSQQQGDLPLDAIPLTTQLRPNVGSVHGGFAVKVDMLQGCDQRTKVAWCEVNGATARASSVDDDGVTCIMPAGKEGVIDVSVSCNGLDFSEALPFIFYADLVVYDVFPLSVSSSGGSVVHLSGRGFQNFARGELESTTLTCSFDEVEIPALWVSQELALCRSPARSPGAVVLRVSSPWHENLVAATNLTYFEPSPREDDYVLSPMAGSMHGGTTVSILGQRRLADVLLCRFGERSVIPDRLSGSEVTCTTPESVTPGTVEIALISSDREDIVGQFEYTGYLQVVGIRPGVVDVEGGTNVTIFLDSRSSYIPFAADVTCRIGDVISPAKMHADGSKVECISPAHPEGSVALGLWGGDHQVSSGHSILFYGPSPVVSRISPTRGFSSEETIVSVYGHHFVSSEDMGCFFGDTRATRVEWVSSSQLLCYSPKLLPGFFQVTVSLEWGSLSTASHVSLYEVRHDALIESIHPVVGHSEGGTVVTVHGRHFPSTGGLNCFFGNAVSPAVVLNQASLKCVSPRLNVGTVDIRLRYSDTVSPAKYNGARAQYQVTSTGPAVHRVSRTSVSIEGGTPLIIDGAHFPNSTQIACRFEGRLALMESAAVWLSSRAVGCTSPSWRRPERDVALHVVVNGKDAAQATNSTAVINFGVSPIIESLQPLFGPESGGTEIWLRGTNFRRSKTVACSICTADAGKCTTLPAQWISQHGLLCVTPKHVPGLTTVQMTDNGLNCTSNELQFTFLPDHHVMSIYPGGGPMKGGTNVLVRGANLVFTNVSKCRFGEISVEAAFHFSGVLCKSPRVFRAHEVFVEVAVNGIDFTSDQQAFRYSGSPLDSRSITIEPNFGDRRGNTTVILQIMGSSDVEAASPQAWECVFGGYIIPARKLYPSSFACLSPEFMREGVVALSLRSTDFKIETASAPFEVMPSIELKFLEPKLGWASGRESVIVHGIGFADTPSACCRFGNETTSMNMLSVTAVRCEKPSRDGDDSNPVLVQVSNNCDGFYGEGLSFLYHAKFPGSLSGSSRLPLDARAGHRRNLFRCSTDYNISDIPDRLAPRARTCVSLVDPLSLHRPLPLNRVVTERADPVFGLVTISPSAGPVQGGSTVELLGVPRYKDGAFCKFRDTTTVALIQVLFFSPGNSVRCVTPPWSASGTVTLQVLGGDMEPLTVGELFTYYLQPVTFSMEPSWGYEQKQTTLRIAAVGSTVGTEPTCGFFSASNALLAASAAVWIANSAVWCQTPALASGSVFVEISANGVDFTQGSALAFTVLTTPVLFNFSPWIGASIGGTEITIRGIAFHSLGSAVCTFGENNVPATIVNSNFVVCMTPAFAHEHNGMSPVVTFALIVDGEEVDSTSASRLDFTYMPSPMILAISPDYGSIAGGTTVHVSGRRFTPGGDVECNFGKLRVRAKIMADNSLLCDSPPHSEGVVAFFITAEDGKIDGSQRGQSFAFSSPYGDSRFPATVPFISRQPREPGGEYPLSTREPGREYPISVISSSIPDQEGEWILAGERVCAAGARRRPGIAGTECNMPDTTIKFFQPDNGPRIGGTPVVVTGPHFALSAHWACRFGSRMVLAHVIDDTRLVCSSPPWNAEIAVNFSVTHEGQRHASQNSVFSYADAPIVTQVRPRIVHGGGATTNISIDGTGFLDSSSLTCVLNGDTVVPGIYVSNKSAVCAVSDDVFEHISDISGYASVEVANNGVDFSSSGCGVVVSPQPIVTGIGRPAAVASRNEDINVFGLYFVDVPELACAFEDHVMPAIWVSTENVLCSLPAMRQINITEVTVAFDHQMVHHGRIVAENAPFPRALVQSATPAFGAADGGTVVSVSGRNFSRRGAIICRFTGAGDVIAQILDDFVVRCVAPPGQVGLTHITIAQNMPTLSATSAAFTYVERPTISRLYPSSGLVDGGTRIVALGSGFANSTDLKCRFSAETVSSAVFVSENEVICTTPRHVMPAIIPVRITVHQVASASFVNYRYVPRVVVLGVSPSRVLFNVSNWLTITGLNFVESSELQCLFDGALPQKARWFSPSLLRCPTPASLGSEVSSVLVTIRNGVDDVSKSAAVIDVLPLSTIRSITPARGFLHQRTQLTIFLQSRRSHADRFRGQAICFFDQDSAQAVLVQAPIRQCDVASGQILDECVAVVCEAPVQHMARNVSLSIVDSAGVALANPAMFGFEALPISSPTESPRSPYGGGSPIEIQLRYEELLEVPTRAGCQFSDSYDRIYVTGVIFQNSPSSLSVACRTPPWRRLSRQQSLVDVKIVADGRHLDRKGITLMYTDRPKCVALAPTWGTDEGGAEVRVRGTGFSVQASFSCTFAPDTGPTSSSEADGPTTVPAIRLSSEELLCISPSRPPGTARVTLSADGDEMDGVLRFLVRSPSKVTSLSPAEGPTAGGTFVHLEGANFFHTGRNVCRFGFYDVPATYVNSSFQTCTSPRAPPGSYPVSIAMDGERFELSGSSFQYVEDIRILSLSPSYGWSTGGTDVNVQVSGLKSYEHGTSLWCLFGENREEATHAELETEIVVCSSPTMRIALPSGALDQSTVAMVSVVTSSTASPPTSARAFGYVLPVTVTAATPARGQAGSRVAILGESFDDSFGLECLFGDDVIPAAFVTSQRIDCTAPINKIGQVNVTVRSAGVLPAWYTLATFTLEEPIVLTSLSPATGRSGESTVVTLTGSGFQLSPDLMCRFGELEVSATFLNGTHAKCLSPPQELQIVSVSVFTRAGASSSNALLFLYESEATLLRLSPSEGSIYGDTPLTIRSDLNTTVSGLSCTFVSDEGADTSSPVEEVGETMQCRTRPSPGLQAGVVAVSLTRNSSTVAKGCSFRFLTPAAIRSVHPQTFHEGSGNHLTVLGQNFVSSSELRCRFTTPSGAAAVSSARFISHAKIWCIIPAWHSSSPDGFYIVVDVTTNGVDYTSGKAGFFLQPKATINAVVPISGPVLGGTAVTVYGTFLFKENLVCRFGILRTPAWIMSNFKVICISPEMSRGYEGPVTFDLLVDGWEVSAKGATFTYLELSGAESTSRSSVQESDVGTTRGVISPPRISHLDPTTSPSAGGASVVIGGSHFTSSSALTCAFGGVRVQATFVSSFAIRCVVPRHMPTEVSLEVSNDGDSFSSSGRKFRYHSDLSITSLNPRHGPAEGSTLVNVTGSYFRKDGNIACRFGEIVVPGVYVSSNRITCWAPPLEGVEAAVPVEVSHWTTCEQRRSSRRGYE